MTTPPVPPRTLPEIAGTLAELYKLRAARNIDAWKVNQDISRRELSITPVEGWEGKNTEQREVSKLRAFAADAELVELSAVAMQHKATLEQIEADIAGLEAERRALEWSIRQQMIDALRLSYAPIDGNGYSDAEAFDAPAQQTLDAFVDDGIPF